MFILAIGTSLFEVLPLYFRKPIIWKNVEFFHSFVDSCIGTIYHHKDFTGRVLLCKYFISPRNNLFHTQRRFFLARYICPNGPLLLRMVQPIRSPKNPGTTVVSIGHLTPWPENPGYRTQVCDNCLNQWMLLYWRIYASLGLDDLRCPNSKDIIMCHFLTSLKMHTLWYMGSKCEFQWATLKFYIKFWTHTPYIYLWIVTS